MPEAYQEIDHPADLAIKIHGNDLPSLFRHAAEGMFSLMRCEEGETADAHKQRVELEADDLETLLVDWLDELLFLSEREQICFDDYDIEVVEQSRLRATVYARGGGRPHRGIKAVTYADMDIREVDTGYETVVTFDV